jgi:hypothetical protein
MTESGASSAAPTPGVGLGIIGLVVDFLLAPLGLILSIVAKVQSNRAGVKNGIATAGIVLGIVFTIGQAILAIVIIAVTIRGFSACDRLGNGSHVVGNSTYYCTPGRVVVGAN